MIQAVIFDMDGVIIDSEKLWSNGITNVLARHNVIYKQEIQNLCMGKSLDESSKILIDTHDLKISPEQLSDEKLNAVLELYKQKLDFMPGFLSLFESLKNRKVKMCIATASNETLMNAVDAKLNLTNLFLGNVIFRTEKHNSKPAPDLFLDAASKLAIKPEDCVVIEDSPHGVKAALNAGMKVVALTSSTTTENLKGADLIVNSLDDINPSVIGLLGLI
jgi:beta-phosphoglucomutase